MKKLSELKPEEKRILAAESCGFKWFNITWNKEQKVLARTQEDAETLNAGHWIWHLTPDYGNDLSTMHEAEKTLTSDEVLKYNHLLASITYQDFCKNRQDEARGWPVFSTAAQRLDAFLIAKGLTL